MKPAVNSSMLDPVHYPRGCLYISSLCIFGSTIHEIFKYLILFLEAASIKKCNPKLSELENTQR